MFSVPIIRKIRSVKTMKYLFFSFQNVTSVVATQPVLVKVLLPRYQPQGVITLSGSESVSGTGRQSVQYLLLSVSEQRA